MTDIKTIFWNNASSMVNLTILLIYLGILIVITSILSLRTRDPDPMLGGRNMPWWLVGASITGTHLSSVAFLVIPVLGYTIDINAIIANLLDPIGIIIVILFFVKFLRKTKDASIYTLLNDRFGRGISLYASGCYIAFNILYGGLILFLVGQALHFVTQADVSGVILLCGFIVIFYTYMTGIEGVMWTDFFQTILLSAAGILSLLYIGESIFDTSVQPSTNWNNIKSIINIGLHDDIFITESLGITLLFFFAGTLSAFSSDQNYGQRYLVARSDKHAQGGLLLAGLCIPFILGMFMLIGVGLFVFYQLNPELLQAGVSNDQVFAYFIANQFPSGLMGLAIVGILAAAMSSIDTSINSGSTVFYCNFWEPFARQTESKVLSNMNVMRNCSFIFGLFSIIAALFVHKYSESIIDFWLKSGSLIMEGLLGLFILMRVSKRAGRKSAWIALICGMSFLSWATLSANIFFIPTAPFHYMWGLPMATVIIVVIGLICAQVFNEKTEAATSEPFIHREEARKSIAKKRKRAKKNMFADSIRPKPFYKFYAGLGILITLFIWHDGDLFSLDHIPGGILLFSASMLFLVMAGPHLIRNHTSKRYLFINLGVLTLALPFCGAVLMFGEPHNSINSGIFVGALAAMGTMLGWTMLGIGTAIGTCLASIVVVFLYPQAGAPDHWIMVVLGAILIFIYFAMDAAKEKFFEEKYLGKMHTILGKASKRVSRHLLKMSAAEKNVSMTEISDAIHAVEDISQTLKAMQGATDVDPEEGQMELSVKTALYHAIQRLDFTSANERTKRVVLTKDSLDFHVLGSREIFENIIYQLLDNGMYYINKGAATTITCHLDRKSRILTISNDGPPVEPEDVPYIFDIAYTTKKNEGLGVGLTYCKKMLEGMRGAIRLTSKPHHNYCEFKVYFPFSYDGKVLNDEAPLLDDSWHE